MLTNYIILHMTDYNPRSPYYMSQSISKVYDPEHCPLDALYIEYRSNYGYSEVFIDYKYSWIGPPYRSSLYKIIDYGKYIETIESSTFKFQHNLSYVSFPAVTTISEHAFYQNEKLKYVDIHNCKTIGSSAFMSCANTELYAQNVETIGSWAFAYNDFTSLNMPKLKYVGNSCFIGCSSLSVINMPNLESAGVDAFRGCGLTEVSLPMFSQTAYRMFYNCQTLSKAYIGECTAFQATFFNCCHLTEVNIPKAEILNNDCFGGCIVLSNISIPLVTKLGVACFDGCIALSNISIPIVSIIDSYCFQATGLTSISTIANYIGNSAFRYCNFLTDVYLHYASVTRLSSNVFLDCNPNLKVHVPTSLYGSYISSYPYYSDILVGDL